MTRYMGTEMEYGVTTPDDPTLSPIVSSTHAVAAFAAAHTSTRSRWDYTDEYPLRDMRGFDLRRYHTVPIVSPDQVGVANLVLTNGARFYVDHAHPEYSAPETSNAWDAMLYDVAGDTILRRAVADVADLTARGQSALRGHDPAPALRIYRNNVDGKGASFGYHENYIYSRDTDFAVLAAALTPYFVTRPVITGAGRVGIGQRSEQTGYQISQRADYFEQESSLETTMNRGIINTRNEPHTDQALRLHVINGDANLSQTATYLKLGMTALILDAIEAGVDFSDLALVDPVAEMHAVSHDLTLTHRLRLRDGRALTALEILRAYHDRISPSTPVEEDVRSRWAEVLERLAHDVLATSHLLDWTAKLALIRGYGKRGLTLKDPKVALLDLQYADLSPERSLYQALVRAGRMDVLVAPETIAQAAATPPADTRARVRGFFLEHFADYIASASWQTIMVHSPRGLARLTLDSVAGPYPELHEDFAATLESFADYLEYLE